MIQIDCHVACTDSLSHFIFLCAHVEFNVCFWLFLLRFIRLNIQISFVCRALKQRKRSNSSL